MTEPIDVAGEIGNSIADRRVRARPARPGDRTSAALLGLTYTPGDLVRDTKTGLTGKVLHAAVHSVVRRPRPAPAG
jgi:hypothetical protein